MPRQGDRRAPGQRILAWLRAGYPEGVPPQDQIALLGILRRRLTDDEIVSIAQQLRAGADGEVGFEDIREALRQATLQTPSADDVARVADRLATGSLTLALADPEPEESPRRSLVRRFVGWVRRGYPSGVPSTDHIALIALLRRRLTADEVIDIVMELRDNDVLPHDTGSIGAAIMGTTQELPTVDEIERVRRVLASGGEDLTAETA